MLVLSRSLCDMHNRSYDYEKYQDMHGSMSTVRVRTDPVRTVRVRTDRVRTDPVWTENKATKNSNNGFNLGHIWVSDAIIVWRG